MDNHNIHISCLLLIVHVNVRSPRNTAAFNLLINLKVITWGNQILAKAIAEGRFITLKVRGFNKLRFSLLYISLSDFINS